MFNLAKKKKNLAIFFILLSFFLNDYTANASEYDNEIDNIRQELNLIKSKNSVNYIKNKEKLERLIRQTQKDYSDKARLNDCKRLISEEKYNAALYELYDLIEQKKELSKSNEYLGDISQKSSANGKNAAFYYEKSLQYDKNNGSAAFKLAKIYLKENNKQDALSYMTTAAENSKDRTVLFEIEDTILNSITPQDNYETNMLQEILGIIYTKQNRLNEAAKAYNEALRNNPNDVFIKYSLANLYFNNNSNENAIAVYNSILREIPYDTQIKALKAKSLAKSGNLLGANKEYLSILQKYPNSKQAKYGIFKIYEGKLPPSKIMEKMNANNVNYKASAFDLKDFAKFLKDLGDEKNAIAFENEAKKLTPVEKTKTAQIDNPTPIVLSGKEVSDNSNIDQIKKALIDKEEQEKIKKAKLQKEQEKKLYEDKMIELERQKAQQKDSKKYAEYQAVLDNYMKIEPKTSKILIAIANTYKLMDEPTSALRYYRKALENDPVNSDIYYNIGLVSMELNDFENAKTYLQKAIGLDSDNKKARNLLFFVTQKLITNSINSAYSQYEKKDYLSAYEILEKSIKEFPNSAQLYYYRALVFDAMKRNSAQIADLNKAIELDPSYYMAYYQLAKTYEKIKEERNALIIYERFLSTEPDEKDLVIEVQKKVETLARKFY